VYSASKAFTTSFGEALRDELRHNNVPVVVCVGGSIDTPSLRNTMKNAAIESIKPQSPASLAEKALTSLERNKGPVVYSSTLAYIITVLRWIMTTSRAIVFFGEKFSGGFQDHLFILTTSFVQGFAQSKSVVSRQFLFNVFM
jgi:short-subunit dehydrogenase